MADNRHGYQGRRPSYCSSNDSTPSLIIVLLPFLPTGLDDTYFYRFSLDIKLRTTKRLL